MLDSFNIFAKKREVPKRSEEDEKILTDLAAGEVASAAITSELRARILNGEEIDTSAVWREVEEERHAAFEEAKRRDGRLSAIDSGIIMASAQEKFLAAIKSLQTEGWKSAA